jgi:hypothetical protein
MLSKARDLAVSLGMRPQVAHCHLDLARLCRSAGRNDEARDHLATAVSMYGEMEMPIYLRQAGTVLEA